MSAGRFGTLPAMLEAEAGRRFVRWDARLWRDLLAGPAGRLLDTLGTPPDHPLVQSYLRLATWGLGLGYLFPTTAGTSFFTLAWTRLIPERLVDVPPERRAQVLAALWNLAENLEQGPAWLRLVLVRQAQHWRLDDLEARLADVRAVALDPPAQDDQEGDLVWIPLADHDRRFLPGALHFVSPTIVCVHERHAGAAQPGATIGVWLTAAPLVLGAMGCEDTVLPPGDGQRIVARGAGDPRLTPVWAAAENRWRAAATLRTSQFLVATRPAS